MDFSPVVVAVNSAVAKLLAARPRADANGGPPIDQGAAQAARLVTQQVALRLRDGVTVFLPAPLVHGTVPGGVQLEWRMAGVSLTVECQPGGAIVVEYRVADDTSLWTGSGIAAAVKLLVPTLQRLLATAALQRQYEPVALRILQEEDLHGAVALRLETRPYIREADRLIAGIQGGERGAAAILPAVLRAFEEEPTTSADLPASRKFAYWRIAERVVREVVGPMRLALGQLGHRVD